MPEQYLPNIAGNMLGTYSAEMDKQRLQGQQDTDRANVDAERTLKKLGGAARYLQQAMSTNNPAAVQGAWRAVRPMLARDMPEGQFPEQWDEATMAPVVHQVLAQTASAFDGGAQGTVHSQKVGQDGFIYNTMRDGSVVNTGVKADRQMWLRDNPGQAPELVGKDGGTTQVGSYSAPPVPASPASAGLDQPNHGALDPTADFPQLASANGAQVSSLYRSKEHNAQVGGVGNSQHMDGTGGDFVVPPANRAAFIQQARVKGYEAIDEGDHVHLELPKGVKASNHFGPGQGFTPAQAKPAMTPAQEMAAQNDAERLRLAQEAADRGSIPPGYRMENGALVKIPGGPLGDNGEKPMTEYQRNQMTMKANGARKGVRGSVDDLTRMAAMANKVLKMPGLERITGFVGAFPSIPGSAASDAQAQLESLKSQISFAVLAKMRAMSPTGGALGSVSDAEGRRLEANLASLDNSQSFDQLKQNLQAIIDYAATSKDNIQSAFDQDFGEFLNSKQSSDAPAGGVDDLLKKYGAH